MKPAAPVMSVVKSRPHFLHRLCRKLRESPEAAVDRAVFAAHSEAKVNSQQDLQDCCCWMMHGNQR